MTMTSWRSVEERQTGRRAIGPIGTLARVALGTAAVAKPLLDGTDGGLQWHEPLIGLALVPAALALIQLLRTWWRSDQLNATGPVGMAITTAVGGALLNIHFTSDAAFLFIGASTLLAAMRGYAGCELLAVSNWLLRRNDQAGCIIFSPVDAIEATVARDNGRSHAT
jgi:hypothetical protein